MRTLHTWLTASALMLGTTSALAESAQAYPPCSWEPTESDLSAAKGAFNAGQVSFNEADYERAILYWEDAYRRDCTANALLLNLARAYELHGDRAQAIVALETYLERVPETPQKDQIKRRISVLKRQLEKQRPQEQAEMRPSETEAGANAGSDGSAPTPESEKAETGKDGDMGPAPTTKKPVAPLIVIGGGAAILAVGAVLFFQGRGDIEEAEESCPTRRNCLPEIEELGNGGRTRTTAGIFVSLGGALTIGGGVAWYVLSQDSDSSAATGVPLPIANTRLNAGIGKDFASVSLSGTF